MTGNTPIRARTPSTSLATVTVLTALVVAGLLRTVGATRAAAVGAVTGVLLALSLWLVGWDRWQAVGTVLASALALPLAVGLAVASAGTVVALGAELFPVPTRAAIRPMVVALVSQVLVVLGCLVAVFGASASVRGVVDTDRVADYAGVLVRTTLLPFLVVAALGLRGAIGYLQSSAGTPGVQQLTGEALRRVLGPVFDPVPGRTHLAVFCLLLAVSAGAVARGVAALPLAELVPETADAPDVSVAVHAVERSLRWTSRLAILVVPVAALVELTAGQTALAATLPGGLYALLVAVTAAPALRDLLWWLLLAGAATSVAVWFLRRAVQSSADRVGTVLAPYVGGAAVVLAVLAAAGPVVGAVETALRATPAASAVDRLFVPVVDVYGAETVALALVVLSLFALVTVVGQLWLALATTSLREATAGVSLAGVGLFVASAFAATLDAPVWLVLAGLVGAFVVWDAGSFGATLGREVGTAASTRRTELVHTGGTVAVGGVGAVATVGLAGLASGSVAVASPVALAALVGCLVAVVALAVALR